LAKPVRVNGKTVLENTVSPEIVDRSYHLADAGTFHIFPDRIGSDRLEVGLFVPNGAKVLPGKLLGERVQQGGGLTNTFAFYFDSGEYKGVEIWFDHVGGTNGGQVGGQNLGNEFIRRNRDGTYSLIGPTNSAGSSQIGIIGGPGGREPSGISRNPLYRHTHVVIKRNGRRIDPRKVFCD
jgi:hypothetical protein